MAGLIKGITIEFSADVTKLNDGLKKTQNTINKTQSELRQVNKSLKFNPGNTTLLKQKFDLLKKAVNETRDKLNSLKQMQKKMDDAGVDKTSAEYRELEREIIKTENQLEKAENELRRFGSVGKQQAIAVGNKFKEAGRKISSAGQTMTMHVTAPLVAGFTASAKYASDLDENLNKLDVAFGKNADSVKKWAESAGEAYGLSQVQATDAASAFGALGKGIGLSEKESANMSTTLAGLSADLGSYFNVGIDESSKALEGIFTGESEALKKFGVVMTDTNLKQFAEDQGLVWSEMSQTEKTMLRYQYVLAKTKDAQGDFSRTSDGTANSLKIFQASIQDLASNIGKALLPIITPVIQKMSEWVKKFNELSPGAQKVITILGLVAAAIGPVLVVVGTLAGAIGHIITLAATIGPVIKGAFLAMTGPIGIVIAAIAAAIAIGVLLYKNWDKIKAKAIEIKDKVVQAWANLKAKVLHNVMMLRTQMINTWNGIKSRVTAVVNALKNTVSNVFNAIKGVASKVWNGVKNAIIKPIQTAKDKVSEIIEKLKGFFPLSIGKIFSNLKLPHFNISGGKAPYGIGGFGTKPTISVDWYKKAMGNPYLFSDATLFGAGESGDEILYGRNNLLKDIAQVVGGAGTSSIVINVTPSPGMDETMLAEKVKRTLITEVKRQRNAWA